MANPINSVTSPPEFNLQHGTFIANLDSNSPNKSAILESQEKRTSIWGKDISEDSNIFGSQPKSTKVIESLHARVDNLSETNLHLTYQSNSLLTKLGEANSKESKYLDTINKLRIENSNLTTMYERKNRKVKELEVELEDKSSRLHSATNESQKLLDQVKSNNENKSYLQDQLEQCQIQYQALQDAQTRYKQHYENEIEKMKSQLNEISRNYEKLLKDKLKDIETLDTKWESSYTKVENSAEESKKIGETRIKDLTDKVKSLEIDYNNNEKLSTIYKQSRDMIFDYAKLMDLDIDNNYRSSHDPIVGEYTKQLEKMEQDEVSKRERLEALSETESILTSTPGKSEKSYGDIFFNDFTSSVNNSQDFPKASNSRKISTASSNTSNTSKRHSSFYGTFGSYTGEVGNTSGNNENDFSMVESENLDNLVFSNSPLMINKQGSLIGNQQNNMSTKEKRATWLSGANSNPSRSLSPSQRAFSGNSSSSSHGARKVTPIINALSGASHSNNNAGSKLPGLKKNNSISRRSVQMTDGTVELGTTDSSTSGLKRAGSVKRRY